MTYSPEQLVDLQAIGDVARRYCRGVDRLDPDVMRSAYWPEATDDHGAFIGPAWEFVDFVMRTHTRWRSTMHMIFNHTIELGADRVSATGEIYNVTTMFRDSREGPVVDTWYGRYLDRYEKRGEEWRIIQRVCVHEATSTAPIAEPMPLDAAKFRTGAFDRPANGRPVGP